MGTYLKDINIEAFDDCIKWIGTGDLVFSTQDISQLGPEREIEVSDEEFIRHKAQGDEHKEYLMRLQSVEELMRGQVSQCLDFVLAAEFLLITQDPAPKVADMIYSIVIDLPEIEAPHKPSTVELDD